MLHLKTGTHPRHRMYHGITTLAPQPHNLTAKAALPWAQPGVDGSSRYALVWISGRPSFDFSFAASPVLVLSITCVPSTPEHDLPVSPFACPDAFLFPASSRPHCGHRGFPVQAWSAVSHIGVTCILFCFAANRFAAACPWQRPVGLRWGCGLPGSQSQLPSVHRLLLHVCVRPCQQNSRMPWLP